MGRKGKGRLLREKFFIRQKKIKIFSKNILHLVTYQFLSSYNKHDGVGIYLQF